jgi:hypothetical protein
MRIPKLLFLLAVLLNRCVLGLAQNEDTTKPSSLLNGNWLLTGSWNTSSEESPRLTVSLGVQGDRVFGGGDFQIQNGASHCGFGSGFFLEGSVAWDGTFVLTAVRTFDSDRPNISIRGKFPQAGSREWPGSFVFPAGAMRGRPEYCPTLYTGDFVATPLPPLKGVYSGSITMADFSRSIVTVEFAEGELTTFEYAPGHMGGFVPLKATMTVSGSSQRPAQTLTAESSASGISNYVKGDQFDLLFHTEKDGEIRLIGRFDASEEKLSVQLEPLMTPIMPPIPLVGVLGGVGMLTRQ